MITYRQSFSRIYGYSTAAIDVTDIGIRPICSSIVAAAALLAACAMPVHAAAPAPASEQSIQNTVWSLQNWTRADNSMRAVPSQKNQATLEFAPANTIIAYTGCNTISGKYSFTQNNLTIQTAWMSRRACFALPDNRFEREYANALMTVAQSLMLSGSPQRLQMTLTNGERLEFLPLPHNPATHANSALRATEKNLKNTKWTLKSWEPANGSMRELPTGEKSLSLNFNDQGRADGYTGCNSMQATYAFANGKLSIQPGVVTLMLCQEIARDQQGNRIPDNARQILEQSYIDALSQIKTADIDVLSSSAQRLLMVLENHDTLMFERNPGWMTDARF